MGRREACLKERYAAQYHCVRPGVWQPAAEVVDRLLSCFLEHPGQSRPIRRGRLLEDDHFEFRGRSSRLQACYTRAGEW